MSNIVYVLTNPAMPGLVKIGMTDRDDVKRRMSDLYTTGVPLPFECLAAREIEDREAADIEKALHTAFGPNRVNSSREFFQIDPEQVQALLRVMPGRDVTPKTPEPDAGAQDEDQAAADEYKKRQARTNELEFMESLNEHGMIAYRRVLPRGTRKECESGGAPRDSPKRRLRRSARPRLLRVSSLCIQPTDIHGVRFHNQEVQRPPGRRGCSETGSFEYWTLQTGGQRHRPLLPDRPPPGRIPT